MILHTVAQFPAQESTMDIRTMIRTIRIGNVLLHACCVWCMTENDTFLLCHMVHCHTCLRLHNLQSIDSNSTLALITSPILLVYHIRLQHPSYPHKLWVRWNLNSQLWSQFTANKIHLFTLFLCSMFCYTSLFRNISYHWSLNHNICTDHVQHVSNDVATYKCFFHFIVFHLPTSIIIVYVQSVAVYKTTSPSTLYKTQAEYCARFIPASTFWPFPHDFIVVQFCTKTGTCPYSSAPSSLTSNEYMYIHYMAFVHCSITEKPLPSIM